MRAAFVLELVTEEPFLLWREVLRLRFPFGVVLPTVTRGAGLFGSASGFCK